MFEGIRSYLSRKSRGGIFTLSKARLMGSSFSEQCSEGYANGWVMRCIRMRVEACSSVPLVLYSDRTKQKEIERHPLLDLLNGPNPNDSYVDLVEDLIGFRQLNGNAYLYAPPTSFQPREIYCLNSGAVTVNTHLGAITDYTYSSEAMFQTFMPQDMMHWMCWNPMDPNRGLSPLQAAAMSVTQNNEAKRWNAAVLQNGGRTWGTFSTDKDLTDTQYKRLKEEVREKYTGSDNAGKPILLEGGLHWEQMGLTSQDMDWLEGMKLSMREICTIFGTPSQLLGDSEVSTYSNFKEANKSYYRSTIVPELASLRDQLNRFFIPKFDRSRKLWLDYNLDSIEALQEDKDLMWSRLNQASWLTINEKRTAAGYEEIVGGDVLLLPMTSIPQDIDRPIEREEPAPVPDPQQDDEEEAEE